MKQDFETSIHAQNTQLYFYGMLFNGASLLLHGNLERILMHGLFAGYNFMVYSIIVVNAALGLTTSLLLKHVDNMFYVLVHQAAVITVLVASIVVFDFHPHFSFFPETVAVGCSIYIFHLSKPHEEECARINK